MKKIKVIHIVEALGGGIFTYLQALSYFFGNLNKDVEIHIIYSANRGEINPLRIKEAFSKNVNLIEIPMVRELSIGKDIKATIQLLRELNRLKPDIIHLHSSKAGVIGRLAHYFSNKKSLVYYTPHGYSFLRTDISDTKKRTYKFIEKNMNFLFKTTTIACGDTEYEIAKNLGTAELIRNGVNVNRIKKSSNPTKNKRLTIGIVGRITEARNPKLFNEIAFKYNNYNFLWIGDGNLRHEITAPNIQITGWMFNQLEVLDYLNSIDVYIQTSLWEGLPIAILEAMALKKPVVATNIIGNKDIVIHNKTGFLFESLDDKLDSYFQALEDENFRRKLGENGLKHCENLFDINKNFYELYLLYKKDFLSSK